MIKLVYHNNYAIHNYTYTQYDATANTNYQYPKSIISMNTNQV